MAQPIYVGITGSSSVATSSPWKLANWHVTPQQMSFAVLSTGGSSWFISVTYEDPSGTYQSLNYSSTIGSSGVTAFTLATGSSNQFVTIGSSMAPIAAYQFTVNVGSSAGAKVNFVTLQAGDL